MNRFYISSAEIDKDYFSEIKDDYLADVPSVKYLLNGNKLNFENNVTFLIGENGIGKSTLLEAIAVKFGFPPECGSKDYFYSTKNSHSDLYKAIMLSKSSFPDDGFFLRAESFYNTATYLDSVGAGERFGGISLHNQSHGESFLATVQYRFSENGLYILDEPEAALSPMKLLSLMAEIKYLVDNNSQFIISTHSPILMAFPDAVIYVISQNGICAVDYKNTEHYQVTKNFLDNPERIFKYLFDNQK